jgi:hypothetical protein
LEEVSPSWCKGWSAEVRSPGMFILVKRWIVKDSRWLARWHSMWEERSFLISYFRFSILASMEECMMELIVVILALICHTSFWVMDKSNDKALRRDSRYWLRVWVMLKGGNKKRVGEYTQKNGYG